MKLVIIGSGNVADVLGRMSASAGHQILQVVGRNRKAVNQLADEWQATTCYDYEDINDNADLYIIALSDSALPGLQGQLKLGNRLVVHTAGSVSTEVLEGISENYGVMYPLQTLKAGDVPADFFPVLVNGNSGHAIERIRQFASSITDMVSQLDDEKRARLHLAAIIVNNFSNHLFALAYDFCQNEGLNFSLLGPLVARTAALAGQNDPALLQTGPAARKDFVTMAKHEKMLEFNHGLRLVYKTMSESIISLQGSGNSSLSL